MSEWNSQQLRHSYTSKASIYATINNDMSLIILCINQVPLQCKCPKIACLLSTPKNASCTSFPFLFKECELEVCSSWENELINRPATRSRQAFPRTLTAEWDQAPAASGLPAARVFDVERRGTLTKAGWEDGTAEDWRGNEVENFAGELLSSAWTFSSETSLLLTLFLVSLHFACLPSVYIADATSLRWRHNKTSKRGKCHYVSIKHPSTLHMMLYTSRVWMYLLIAKVSLKTANTV